MLKRLLITGAAGGIGQEMRMRLSHVAEIIRVSDKNALKGAGPKEEVMWNPDIRIVKGPRRGQGGI